MPAAATSQDGVVIVGGGHAGCQLAASLRDQAYVGRITIVAEEPHLPYQRPPLSKTYLDGTSAVSALALRTADFFSQAKIILARDQRAIGIDRVAQALRTEDGEHLHYEHLVLATGARNRRLRCPGAELRGVLQLRSLADADVVRDALRRASRIVIVGAGFIGLELAALAAGRGHHVNVVEAADRPMARSLSEPMSRFFREAHEATGVTFHFGDQVAQIDGEQGHVVSVRTVRGLRLAADLLLVGVGVLANDDLARAAGLATDNGVLVDDHLRTADPAISSIGDCAACPQAFAEGALMRIESVQNAVDQARCLAARITGKPAPYAAIPWFWSHQGQWKLQIAGLSARHDRTVLRGEPSTGAFSVFCYRSERLVAVESVNKPADHMIARRLIGQGKTVSPEMAADAAFDLRALAEQTRVAA